MLLAMNDLQVLAITCSQGILSPSSGAMKVNSLLAQYYHNGFPIDRSNTIDYPYPSWNRYAEGIQWGNEYTKVRFAKNSIELLNSVSANYLHKITLIALGSLKTYADWFKNNPSIAQKVDRIIWYNASEQNTCFNYLIDTASFSFFQKSNIPLQIVSNDRHDLICNQEYLAILKSTNSMYASHL
jgi:pyrimidine-specific ribonucleoside hydrolase